MPGEEEEEVEQEERVTVEQNGSADGSAHGSRSVRHRLRQSAAACPPAAPTSWYYLSEPSLHNPASLAALPLAAFLQRLGHYPSRI